MRFPSGLYRFQSSAIYKRFVHLVLSFVVLLMLIPLTSFAHGSLRTDQGRGYPTFSDRYTVKVPRLTQGPGGTTSQTGYNSTQPYTLQYNGKELQLFANTNLIDYGARQYNPLLARWLSQDPMAEKYYGVSPYTYCAGNPVMFTSRETFFYDLLYDIITDDKNLTKINVVNASSDVIIGDAVTATIDIADILAMDKSTNSSAAAALLHETVEQSLIQDKNFYKNEKYNLRLFEAHKNAEDKERKYFGNVGVHNYIDLENKKNKTGILWFGKENSNKKVIVIEIIRFINGNF